ncbi:MULTISPECIES: hypothetical protein [Oceanobacillus]|uniref:Uncharacterized protein n=1 Tax=Oceanobacillus aidingensis TaxID=645964 RepID=A0ABV9JYT6_9BACI|nr:hypothetical protein [Oceanobacillus oncorhynchi]MDM8102513.1 hypothetical protein [Oceanobacillus oncorhynchi]
MTKTKWALLVLGIMDLVLIMMHDTDYYFLFLKPTGYVIPMVINLIVLAAIGFRAKLSIRSNLPKIWTIAGLVIFIPIILFHGFMVLLMEYSYTKIDSPYDQQSLVIEHRSFTLGETTYSYNFYKTKFGFIGKQLDDQSISIVARRRDYPSESFNAENALGLGNVEWLTADSVRFHTWKGTEDVYLDSTQPSSETDETENLEEAIEQFMDNAEKKEGGQTITVNGNTLTVRYDAAANQEWIDIANENEAGAIPTQQCSRIVPNKERGYYMLEECTHQWEYPLYPMSEKR